MSRRRDLSWVWCVVVPVILVAATWAIYAIGPNEREKALMEECEAAGGDASWDPLRAIDEVRCEGAEAVKSIAAAIVASTLCVLALLAEYHNLEDVDGWNETAALALIFFGFVVVFSSTPRPVAHRRDSGEVTDRA